MYRCFHCVSAMFSAHVVVTVIYDYDNGSCRQTMSYNQNKGVVDGLRLAAPSG